MSVIVKEGLANGRLTPRNSSAAFAAKTAVLLQAADMVRVRMCARVCVWRVAPVPTCHRSQSGGGCGGRLMLAPSKAPCGPTIHNNKSRARAAPHPHPHLTAVRHECGRAVAGCSHRAAVPTASPVGRHHGRAAGIQRTSAGAGGAAKGAGAVCLAVMAGACGWLAVVAGWRLWLAVVAAGC